jgi:hypothetical protein
MKDVYLVNCFSSLVRRSMQHALTKMMRRLILLIVVAMGLVACGGYRPRIGEYQLDTELPSDLPDQAWVYRVVESQTPPAEWARQVAAELGFEGEPASHSESAALPQWSWSRARSSESLYVDGSIAFQCSPPDGDTGTGPLETAAEAVAAARAWLTARDLLPAACADDVHARAYQLQPEASVLQHLWEVSFHCHLDGRPVQGYWGIRGTIQVRLDADEGRVIHVTYVHRQVEPDELVPVKTVEEAWQDLKSGRYAFVDGTAPLPEDEGFSVTEVTLGYREGFVGGSEEQRQLRPYYIFNGQVSPSQREAAYVPAQK